jgi:hypothetical protein
MPGVPIPEKSSGKTPLRPSEKTKKIKQRFCACDAPNAFVLASLCLVWCVVDKWNTDVVVALFQIGDMQVLDHGVKVNRLPKFDFPLTLAFLQVAFSGVVFLFVFCTFIQDADFSWDRMCVAISRDRRWLALTIAHLLSTMWFHMLTVPAQAAHAALFAACRAGDIPLAGVLRAPIVGAPLRFKSFQIIGLLCAASAILYFAATRSFLGNDNQGLFQLWSASGLAFIFIVAMPSTRNVLQEGVLQEPQLHPVLMLALQNLMGSALCLPLLGIAQYSGWEDVNGAVNVISGYREIYMLIVWLCIQVVVLSAITVAIISFTNSVWATTLHALRVVYWWISQLVVFYVLTRLGGYKAEIVSSPHLSPWSLAMLCGFILAAFTIYKDCQAEAVVLLPRRTVPDASDLQYSA